MALGKTRQYAVVLLVGDMYLLDFSVSNLMKFHKK